MEQPLGLPINRGFGPHLISVTIVVLVSAINDYRKAKKFEELVTYIIEYK